MSKMCWYIFFSFFLFFDGKKEEREKTLNSRPVERNDEHEAYMSLIELLIKAKKK